MTTAVRPREPSRRSYDVPTHVPDGPPVLGALPESDNAIIEPLNPHTLRAWATAYGISEAERRQRLLVEQQWLHLIFEQEHCDYFSLTHLGALTSLPQGLAVFGHLNLLGCSSLVRLPEALTVGGNLCLKGCASLTHLPAGLCVGGYLDLEGCISLTDLPSGLSVGGDLDLVGTSITSLPEDISVDGDICLHSCTSLTSLPQRLSARSLNLRGCSALTLLPHELSLGGYLDLSFCTSLTSLPEGLHIGGYLSLNGCTGLMSLPPGLRVGGDLDLSGCTGLTSLPEEIATWGAHANGCIRTIELPHAGISDHVRSNIVGRHPLGMLFRYAIQSANLTTHASNMPGQPNSVWRQNAPQSFIAAHDAIDLYQEYLDGRQAHIFMQPGASAATPSDILATSHQFWRQQAEPLKAPLSPHTWTISAWDLPAAAAQDLAFFLTRLKYTQDYHNAQSRPYLAVRVLDLLMAMNDDQQLRELCSAAIIDAMASCNDRVILVLNQLESALHLHRAERAPQNVQALHALGLSMMRLDIVHEHARHKIKTLQFADDIEVYLAYETKLRKPLSLPVSTQYMLFEHCAQVTELDIQLAYEATIRAVESPQRVTAFLCAWRPWQIHERREAAAALSWHALPEQQLVFAQGTEPQCPITGLLLEHLKQPILYQQNGQWRICECEDFLTWWITHGTEPMLNQSIALSALSRHLSAPLGIASSRT